MSFHWQKLYIAKNPDPYLAGAIHLIWKPQTGVCRVDCLGNSIRWFVSRSSYQERVEHQVSNIIVNPEPMQLDLQITLWCIILPAAQTLAFGSKKSSRFLNLLQNSHLVQINIMCSRVPTTGYSTKHKRFINWYAVELTPLCMAHWIWVEGLVRSVSKWSFSLSQTASAFYFTLESPDDWDGMTLPYDVHSTCACTSWSWLMGMCNRSCCFLNLRAVCTYISLNACSLCTG